MLRRNLTKWTLAAAVAVTAVAIANTSDAGWRHHGSWGSSGGSWGSSGGSWGSSGGSWGSSGGSWGGHRRWWHSSGGSWGSSGGYNTYYGSSGGSWGSSGGSYGGTVIYDNGHPPANPPSPPSGTNNDSAAPTDGETPPAPMPGAVYRRLGGSQVAMLNVNVPAEAKIFVNGAETTSTGTQRQYISRGLNGGNRYAYEVRAEIVRDGQTVTETKSITLGAGQQATLAFNFDSANEAPVAKGEKAKTKLTLRVPTDAKVFLAGRETTSTGDVREYTTMKLENGTEWNNYTVRVVANVDGREMSKEETISLVGGEDRELNFDFNSADLASTAAVTR